MGRELALAFPQAREAFELADRILADRYEQPLSRYLFPPPTFTDEERASAAARADRHARRPGGAGRDRAGLSAAC